MIERGDIAWADLGDPVGSRPAGRRPVVVVQSDAYTDTRLATVVVALITSNTALAVWPGNAFLPATATGLPRDSVVNITAVVTLDKGDLDRPVGRLAPPAMAQVDAGLRRVLGLEDHPRPR